MNHSVIIIGGGLGGLFTGAILSMEGLDVTVLEKNAIVGGGLQSFLRFGELFDTGMHIIGGMQKDGNIRRICEYLGIMDRVHIKDTDPGNIDSIYIAEDRRTYHIAQGRVNFVETLCREFPDQREGLEAYVDALYRLTDEVDLFYLRPAPDYMQVHSEMFQMPAKGFIEKFVSDRRLQSVLAYLNPLYGGRENSTPAYIHALISVLYIDGSSRFAGGSLLFAETLRDYIIEHGGRIRVGDAVSSVHSEGKMITGVTTAGGKNYSADYYICAIHPCSFFTLLDDETILPKPYRNRLNGLPNSYSAFTLNIKLKENSFRYFNYTMYYMSRYDEVWKIVETDAWPCGFLCVTPPEINQGEYARKLIVTAPIHWDSVRQWEDTVTGRRGKEYEAWKADCAEKLLDRIEELYPDFRNCIEAVNSASPLTIRDFYGVKEGSMYGFSKDCNNLVLSQVPVVTKVPNLFLTGQNCNLHGFCGVSLTAINTCEAMLGRNYILNKINRFNDIRPYHDSEIHGAMQRIARNPLLEKVIASVYPGCDPEPIRQRIGKIVSVAEFQHQVMAPAVGQILQDTCTSYTYDGLERIDPDRTYLYISNHRDIVLDASLLSYILISNGYDTPEITFGANLMQNEFVVDVGKSNKMFRVERPGGNMREFYRLSGHLSDYIRTTLLQKRQSVWIAQRNGRTKDGVDRTDPGLVKMLALNGSADRADALAELGIIPVAVSYEWEPCDLLKAVEVCRRMAGPYEKKPGEDLNSIVTGLLQQKGRAHLTFCEPLTGEDLRRLAAPSANDLYRQVASLIDGRICAAYELFPNNYIAHDILSGGTSCRQFYSDPERTRFETHLAGLLQEVPDADKETIRRILLGIYANPVESKRAFGG